MTDWRPRYGPPSASIFQVYRKGDRAVALHLRYYHHQSQDAQLISSWNIMVHQKDPVWADVGEFRVQGNAGSGTIEVRETRLRSPRQRLLVWDWFRIAGHDVINPYVAKALLAWERLTDRGDDGTAIMIVAPYEDNSPPPVDVLQEFMRDMLPSIDATLSHVADDVAADKR